MDQRPVVEFQNYSTNAAVWATSESLPELVERRRQTFKDAMTEGTEEAKLVKQVEQLLQRVAELEKRKPAVSRSTKAPRRIILGDGDD